MVGSNLLEPINATRARYDETYTQMSATNPVREDGAHSRSHHDKGITPRHMTQHTKCNEGRPPDKGSGLHRTGQRPASMVHL